MEYDVTELVKRAIRRVLIRELRTDIGALARNDWNWVKENVLTHVISILKEKGIPDSEEQIEYYIREQWGISKGERIEREFKETLPFVNV